MSDKKGQTRKGILGKCIFPELNSIELLGRNDRIKLLGAKAWYKNVEHFLAHQAAKSEFQYDGKTY